LNGLGVVRSLAKERIPVVAVDAQSSRAALWSRHARNHLVRSLTGAEFVEDLIHLGKQFDSPPILLLTAEEAVHAVSENRDELSKWFRFRIPEDQRIKLLSSKANFHAFALHHDFPVPRTAILEELSDLPHLDQLHFPCVLKPDDKRSVLTGHKNRAVRVASLSEARERASAMLSTPGGIVAQEWIEGPESNIYFTLFYRGAEGKLVGIFTGRKLSCYPHDVGSTALCVAAPQARKALEPLTMAFAERAGFDGMGSMEYKWDENHRRFVMVEPTVGRTDWQEEIATLSGVNLPAAAYRYELGLPAAEAISNREPTAWRATFVDRAPQSLMVPGTRVVDGYFRWNDPMPALKFYCLDHPLRRIMRRWNRSKSSAPADELLDSKVRAW
jgi:predicted ATP-grasp superfamily ATP-dependent carboligase